MPREVSIDERWSKEDQQFVETWNYLHYYRDLLFDVLEDKGIDLIVYVQLQPLINRKFRFWIAYEDSSIGAVRRTIPIKLENHAGETREFEAVLFPINPTKIETYGGKPIDWKTFRTELYFGSLYSLGVMDHICHKADLSILNEFELRPLEERYLVKEEFPWNANYPHFDDRLSFGRTVLRTYGFEPVFGEDDSKKNSFLFFTASIVFIPEEMERFTRDYEVYIKKQREMEDWIKDNREDLIKRLSNKKKDEDDGLG